MTSASSRALGVYELLENIILSTSSAGDIFILQRVNKAWRDVIAQSKDIRQLCFIEPQGTPVEPKNASEQWSTTLADKRIVYQKAAFKINGCLVSYRDEARYRDGGSADFNTYFKLPKHGDNHTITRSSYRQLYLTQPPCTSVAVKVNYVFERGCMLGGGEVYRNPAGVRMGEVEDWVVASGHSQHKADASGLRRITVKITEHQPVRRRWDSEAESEEESED